MYLYGGEQFIDNSVGEGDKERRCLNSFLRELEKVVLNR